MVMLTQKVASVDGVYTRGDIVTQIILRFPSVEIDAWLNTSSEPVFLRLPRRLFFDVQLRGRRRVEVARVRGRVPSHALLRQVVRLLLCSESSAALERTFNITLRAAVRHVPCEPLDVHQQSAALGAL